MKIDRETATATLGGSTGPAATGGPAANRGEQRAHGLAAPDATTAGRPAATVALSARSRELHEALRAAHAASDVRSDRVRQIRTQLDQGTYVVDPAAIAGGMLDRRA